MFTAGGGPGEVHSYFSPYESAMDAFAVAQTLLLEFESRLRLYTLTANEPFLFHTGLGKEYFTGVMSWSLRGFVKALRAVDVNAVEFHNSRGDFEPWAEHSLKDNALSQQLNKVRVAKLKGETLRNALITTAEKRLSQLVSQTQVATGLF